MRIHKRIRHEWSLAALPVTIALAGLLGAATAGAQDPSSAATEPGDFVALSASEIVDLVGPIALYPDDLIGIILPASTYPLQIVQAARFLDALEDDPSLEPDPDWDNSIVALLNYPEVLRQLDADLDWTWTLGQAVLNQQSGVIDAIQSFREQAYLAGNLHSDDHQTVSEDDEGAIEIAPADPEVIYIPYYEPERVVVRQSAPAYYYYDRAYPVYYYPYRVGYAFGSPFFWGVTSAFSIGWHTHFVHVYHPSYFGHPYYGYAYDSPYYWRRGINININLNHVSHIWQPDDHRAGRPNYRRGAGRSVRSTEDYTNSLRRARTARGNGRESVAGASAGTQPRQAPRRVARRAGTSVSERTPARAANDSRSTRTDGSTANGAADGSSLTLRNQGRRIGAVAERGSAERRATAPGQRTPNVATRPASAENPRIVTSARAQQRVGGTQPAAPQARSNFTRVPQAAATGRSNARTATGPRTTAPRASNSSFAGSQSLPRSTAPRSVQPSTATRSATPARQPRAAAPRRAPARSAAPRSDIRTGNGRLPRRN